MLRGSVEGVAGASRSSVDEDEKAADDVSFILLVIFDHQTNTSFTRLLLR